MTLLTLFLVDGKNKRLKIADSKFLVHNVPLKALLPGDSFRYLCVIFRTDGLVFFSPVEQ